MPDLEGPPQRFLATPALSVWVYDSAMGAAAGEVRLKSLRQRGALRVHDAITVSWMPGAHQPRIGHLRRETSAGAARSSVLGGLVDLVFLGPGIAALATRLQGTGVDLVFLEELKSRLHAETSALLVLSSDADLDVVRPIIERGLVRGDVTLMHALLPGDAPELLRTTVRELQNSADESD